MQIPCWNRVSISCRFLVFAYKRRPTYIAKGGSRSLECLECSLVFLVPFLWLLKYKSCAIAKSDFVRPFSIWDLIQHPVSPTFSVSRTFEFKGQKPKSKAISCLPETYRNVKPAFLKSKPNPPILQTPMSMSDLDYPVRNLRLEYEWLQFVSLTNEVLDVETVSWSAYHTLTSAFRKDKEFQI
jgi:hypothetical protein